jgi:hypothetical protein
MDLSALQFTNICRGIDVATHYILQAFPRAEQILILALAKGTYIAACTIQVKSKI